MTTDYLRNLAGFSNLEKDIPVPYDTGELATFFHRDAIILLTLSEMLQGDSVLFPRGYTTQDMQRLVLATFPLIFTYYEDKETNRMRVWRLK